MSTKSSCSRYSTYSTYSRYSTWQYYEIQNNIRNIWNLLFRLSLITFRYSLKSLAFFNSFYRHHRPNMRSKFCNISFHDQLTTIVSGVSGRTKPFCRDELCISAINTGTKAIVLWGGQILLGVLVVIKGVWVVRYAVGRGAKKALACFSSQVKHHARIFNKNYEFWDMH